MTVTGIVSMPATPNLLSQKQLRISGYTTCLCSTGHLLGTADSRPSSRHRRAMAEADKHQLFSSDVRNLLTRTKVSTLLHDKPLVILRQETTVELALQTLAGRKILSAPVVGPPDYVDPLTFTANSPNQDIVCFVDIRDILVSFLEELDEETLGKAKMLRRMQILEAQGSKFATRPLQSLPVIGGDGSFFQYRAAAMSVMELVHDAILYPRETKAIFGGSATQKVVHRCALFDKDSVIRHILSQSDVARFLFENRASLGSLGSMTARELGWADRKVITVTPEMAALDAAVLMAKEGIAGVGVVNSLSGALIGNFSFSDLRTMCAEHFSSMALPVAEFLALEHGTEYCGVPEPLADRAGPDAEQSSSPQSPAARAFAGSTDRRRRKSVGAKVGQALLLATPEDTFTQVLGKMVTYRLHRLYVTDSAFRPIGIVTLTDILRTVTQQSQ